MVSSTLLSQCSNCYNTGSNDPTATTQEAMLQLLQHIKQSLNSYNTVLQQLEGPQKACKGSAANNAQIRMLIHHASLR